MSVSGALDLTFASPIRGSVGSECQIRSTRYLLTDPCQSAFPIVVHFLHNVRHRCCDTLRLANRWARC